MIERVLTSFTSHYYSQNKEIIKFGDSDTLYTLIYAILMLNTDLHNPTVVKKTSVDEIIKTWTKIFTNNLEESTIRDIYADIQQNQIKCMRSLENAEFPKSNFCLIRHLERPKQVSFLRRNLIPASRSN